MKLVFEQEYLRELYETGKTTDKKHRFQPSVVSRYQKTVRILRSVPSAEYLFRYNGLRYEILRGDKEGLESVRVNDQYRLEFKTTEVVSEAVVIVCNVIELSNHYK